MLASLNIALLDRTEKRPKTEYRQVYFMAAIVKTEFPSRYYVIGTARLAEQSKTVTTHHLEPRARAGLASSGTETFPSSATRISEPYHDNYRRGRLSWSEQHASFDIQPKEGAAKATLLFLSRRTFCSLHIIRRGVETNQITACRAAAGKVGCVGNDSGVCRDGRRA